MDTSLNSTTINDQCPGPWVITSLSVCILISGIIGNAVVVKFVRRDLKSRKTPDRVLLMQLSAINLLGCLISLPLQYLDVVHIGRISLSLSVSNAFCFTKLFTLFYCMYAGYATLVILCYDRYEAITKFPQHRILTYAGTLRSIGAILVTTFLVVFLTFIFYIKDFLDENTVCEGLYLRGGATMNNLNQYGNISLIVITTLVITVSSSLCLTCLFLVDRKLRHHMESVRSTLGNQSPIREIRMVRSAFAFVLTYCCVWIPFGIARSLRNISPDSSPVTCFYLTTFTASYSTFSIIPYVYMICDKRIGNPLAKYLRRNRVALDTKNIVSSSNADSSSTRGTKKSHNQENPRAT